MTTSGAAQLPPRSERGLRLLLSRIWQAVLANRGLVAAIVLAGVVQAFCAKGSFVLVGPLLEALAPAAEPAAGVVAENQDRFMQWFDGVARDLSAALGILEGNAMRPMRLCLACAVIAIVLGVIGAVSMYATLLLTRYFAAKIVVDLRNDIAAHLLRLPLGFFGRRRMGELISNVTTDTTVLTRAFQLAADHVVMDPLLILGNVLVIIWAVPEAVWLLVFLVPVMALPLVRLGKQVHKNSRKSLAAMGDATEAMNQMLSGIKTVKAFQLEEERHAEFADSNARYLHRTRRLLHAKALSQAMVFSGYQVGFAVMLLGTGWLVVGENYPLKYLSVALIAISTTYTHVKRLARAYNTLLESSGAMDRIESILGELPDAPEPGAPVGRVRGDVKFEGVGFSYGHEPVLTDVTFAVEAGQTVALVGPSGAGKTTALDVLARFYRPTSGRVSVDGTDIQTLDVAGYRRNIAIVTQEPFLFNTTLAENIRHGRPTATQDEVEEAARAAQIHDFIASLPQGYATVAGERGSNLSGGQTQRVAIARAILRDPAILILDEATSALDAEHEAAVQTALQNLMRGRTSFVIAHRLSTISSADLILVMQNGCIVEKGTHHQLLQEGGLYSRLSQLQRLA